MGRGRRERQPVIVLQADTRQPRFHVGGPGNEGERRNDMAMLCEALGARFVDDNDAAEDRLARLAGKIGGRYTALAVAAFKQRHSASAFVTASENEAIVLAGLLKLTRCRVPVTAIGHYPARPTKDVAWRLARVQTHLHRLMCLGSVQAERLVHALGVPPEKVELLPFGVDAKFWRAERATPRRMHRPYVFAAGLQHRDHRTVAEAVQGLGVDLLIAAASPWSTTGNEFQDEAPPPGVIVESPDIEEFRNGYAGAVAVVTSVVETDFPAGTTTILEGMAMGRPVIVARAEGTGDYVTDRRRVLRGGPLRATSATFSAGCGAAPQGQTGFYFAPGDVEGLRSILRWIIDHPEEAAVVGARARAVVEHMHTLESYVGHIARTVRESIAAAGRGPVPPSPTAEEVRA